MKKFIITLALMFFQISMCQAATQLKVVAIEEFKTTEPSETLDVKVLQSATLGNYDLGVNSILHCKVLQVVDPKRGKRNASFYVKPLSYTVNNTTCTIDEDFYGKYSKFVLSKEEIKEIPPGKVIKSAAMTVGNYFVKGLSTCVAFVQGVAKNEEHNRLKSGVVNAYEESPLSYISEGQQLDIKVGDDFYLVFKTKEDEEEEAKESKESKEPDNNVVNESKDEESETLSE